MGILYLPEVVLTILLLLGGVGSVLSGKVVSFEVQIETSKRLLSIASTTDENRVAANGEFRKPANLRCTTK